jgi:FMN phosphatase YigB (HAD superfamily)
MLVSLAYFVLVRLVQALAPSARSDLEREVEVLVLRHQVKVLRTLGVKIALVSDIHFDLRADLANRGVADLFDAYVLSFEHGFQKPDPRMFRLASTPWASRQATR